MRTTLTIDDDVAAALERLRKQRDVSLKQIVNEALRKGIGELHQRRKRGARYQTRVVNLGQARLSIDNISEVLSIAEENH
jgi:hypothetical protein